MYQKSTWNKRQKLIVALTIITFIVLIWQIYSLVHRDIRPTEVSVASSSTSNTQNLVSVAPVTPNAETSQTPSQLTTNAPIANPNFIESSTATPQTNTTALQPTLVTQLPHANISNSSLELNQREYMQFANQYELAKMKRQLLEEEVAIANARKSIANTEQETNKVLGGNSLLDDDGITNQNWRLTFLSQFDGQWHATIIHNGQYVDVVKEDHLENGIKILDIDKNGVTFKYQGKRQLLTFKGLIILPSQKKKQDQSSLSTPPALIESHSPENTSSTAISAKPASSQTPAVPSDALPNFYNPRIFVHDKNFD